MKQRRTNQAGFSAGAIIAAVLVLAVIGGVGLVVFKKHVERNSAGAAQTVSPPKVTNPKPTPATPAASGAVLEVKEWGVSIPLPESLKDAYYVVSTSSANPDGSPNTIWVGLKSIPECTAENANRGGKALASITRSAPDYREPVSGELYMEAHPDGVTIDKYYYLYNTWSLDNNCTTAEQFKKVDDNFKPAFKNTKASANAAGN
jgi:hypothetical protein